MQTNSRLLLPQQPRRPTRMGPGASATFDSMRLKNAIDHKRLPIRPSVPSHA
jgi:hypothetical protein